MENDTKAYHCTSFSGLLLLGEQYKTINNNTIIIKSIKFKALACTLYTYSTFSYIYKGMGIDRSMMMIDDFAFLVVILRELTDN